MAIRNPTKKTGIDFPEKFEKKIEFQENFSEKMLSDIQIFYSIFY